MKLRIKPADAGYWSAWPEAIVEYEGRPCRSLLPGQCGQLLLPLNRAEPTLLVVVLVKKWSKKLPQTPAFLIDGQTYLARLDPDFPFLLTIVIPRRADPDGASETVLELRAPANVTLRIQEVLALPARGRFSRYWAKPWRRIKSRLRSGPLEWAQADFPYSHLDGNAYLRKYSSLRRAVIEDRFKSAAHYFYARGRKKGMPVLLAVDEDPSPGTPYGFVSSLLSELKSSQSDNSVMLALLDRAREELRKQS